MSSKGHSTILLLTTTQDVAADFVVLALQRLGVDFIRFNEDLDPSTTQFTWGAAESFAHVDGRMHSLDYRTSVWCRRFGPTRLASRSDRPSIELYMAHEAATAIVGVLENVQSFWMNNPWRALYAENKAVQLKVAAQLGFTVPRSIVTNHPASVKLFRGDRAVVAKPVSAGKVAFDGGARLLYTTAFDSDWEIIDGHIAACPIIVQDRIDKAYDLRITVVGERLFATRIVAPSEPVDWRAAPEHSVEYEEATIPDDLSAKCLELLAAFGLSYGAIDMVVDKAGAFFFLELNPSGQWAWLERATGQGISGAIAATLVSRS